MTTFPICSLRARRMVAATLLPALLASWCPLPVVAQPAGLPDLGESSATALSPRLERRLGEAIMAASLHDPDYVNDADVLQYLTALGTRLAEHAQGGAPDIHVFAVRDASVNAFAMPGGFIGVHAGLVVASRSESELAGVLAHEIGHVVQRHIARGLVQQKQDSLIMVAALLAALVAARGNSHAPQAALAFGQAAAIDSQLGFSREAEREADRTGFQMLQAAGYDVNGMATFFGRLMQLAGVNERTGSSFARTHPLSIERMSDMQNRAREAPPPTRADSPDFLFVRAKLRVLQSRDAQETLDAISALQGQAGEATGMARAALLYGSAVGWLQRRDLAKARQAYEAATSGARDHPMLARLSIDLAMAEGQPAQALALARSAIERWPAQRGLALSYAQVLQRSGRHQEAVDVLRAQIARWPDMAVLYQMAANSYSKLGQGVPERRYMADYYAMTGALPAAVEQLQQARSASRDFYEQSQIDAKVRELQQRLREERDLLKRFEG